MGFDLGDSPCIESKQIYAYTVNGDQRNPQGYPSSIIQLCPWYLEQIGVPSATNSLKGLKPDDQRIKNIQSDWEEQLGADGRAEIDTFALLPTTVLHEVSSLALSKLPFQRMLWEALRVTICDPLIGRVSCRLSKPCLCNVALHYLPLDPSTEILPI